MLGWVAAVMAIVSPSQPSPAVTHRTSISVIGGVSFAVASSATQTLSGADCQHLKDSDPTRQRLAQRLDPLLPVPSANLRILYLAEAYMRNCDMASCRQLRLARLETYIAWSAAA